MALSGDQLAITAGLYWTPPSKPATITYTLEGRSETDVFGRTVITVDDELLSGIQAALNEWSKVSNITFVYIADSASDPSNPFSNQNTGDADITFSYDFNSAFFDSVSVATLTGTNPEQGGDPDITSATVQINELIANPDDFVAGTSDFTGLINSIGITLGLAWGRGVYDATLDLNGDGNLGDFIEVSDKPSAFQRYVTNQSSLAAELKKVFLADGDNNYDTSIMLQQGNLGIHTLIGGVPITPQILDIEVIQYLYGANLSYRTGNDTYNFNGTPVAQTLWDASGTDTITTSVTSGVFINLDDGDIDNPSQMGSARVWIASNAEIENATGNSGDDTLQGSEGANSLRGLNGSDSINGGAGDDFINGNANDDIVNGGSGNDRVLGGKDTDIVNGDTGNDFINGNIGTDNVNGGSGNDTVHGGQDSDTLNGGDGNDDLYGDLGNDNLTGGNGADNFVFNASSGVDTVTDFVRNTDTIQISSSIFTTTTQALAATNFSGGDAIINLGGGNQVTLTGITTLAITDFEII